jgi:hypothetical protein
MYSDYIDPSFRLNPTAANDTNRVLNEVVAVPNVMRGDIQFIYVPLYGPFFEKDLKVSTNQEDRLLINGHDYVLGLKHEDASLKCNSDVYSCIIIVDANMNSSVTVNYTATGGDTGLVHDDITPIIKNMSFAQLTTQTLEQVFYNTKPFPAGSNAWNNFDWQNVQDVKNILNKSGYTYSVVRK